MQKRYESVLSLAFEAFNEIGQMGFGNGGVPMGTV